MMIRNGARAITRGLKKQGTNRAASRAIIQGANDDCAGVVSDNDGRREG
jgi:hypothetical protein